METIKSNKEKVIAFPRMGKEYTLQIKKSLESIGLKVMMPPNISDNTVKLGVKNSADMMCYPYKTTLGNHIESLEMGANILFMYDNCGECRQRHYGKIHEFTLRKLGYDFELYLLNWKNIVPILAKLSNKSLVKVFYVIVDMIKQINRIDKNKYNWSVDKLNIGIIGEIYTCCEEQVNYNIEQKLRKMGVNPYNTSCLSSFIQDRLKFGLVNFFGKTNYKKLAKKYLNGPLGGHGLENIYNLLWMIDKKVDGIVHLLPLSCMPEATIEPIINDICQEARVPLLRLPIDETNSEANIATRVETFAELIKRKNLNHCEKTRSAMLDKEESHG